MHRQIFMIKKHNGHTSVITDSLTEQVNAKIYNL